MATEHIVPHVVPSPQSVAATESVTSLEIRP